MGVVNCFQNVTFLGKSQQGFANGLDICSCELLSKCYFPREITAAEDAQILSQTL